MKCIIPSQNVKILARAIHSLAKIGDEMYIETSEDELVLRTINAAKSAFGEYRMCRSFFSSFNFSLPQDQDTSCKVTMKSSVSVFKSAHGMDKQVENCEIRIKPESTQVVFQIKFVNSSVKKYYLPIIENDQLEAQIPKEAPNQLCASSKFLSAAVKNFRHSEDEITLAVSKDKTTIKNHLELRKDVNSMRTELAYHQTEFENYIVGNPTDVTFCLKELRAVIMFAEPANLPVLISFTQPGSPIVFQVQNHPAYEANYVVSTLHPNNVNRSSRTSISQLDSPGIPLRTLSDSGKRRNSQAGYSFEEETPIQEPFVPSKRLETSKNRPDPVSAPEPLPSTSFQTDLMKSIRLQFDLSSSQGTNNESMRRDFEIRRSATSIEPQPGTSKESDYLSPFVFGNAEFTGVVPESEASSRLSQSSLEGSICRVDTVIQGMNASSQPSAELLKTVFSRCFSKDHFLNVLVGHDVVLEESSDREMT